MTVINRQRNRQHQTLASVKKFLLYLTFTKNFARIEEIFQDYQDFEKMTAVAALPEPTINGDLPAYDLWEPRFVNNEVQSTHIEKYYPISGINPANSSPFVFKIQGNSDFINLSKATVTIKGKFAGNIASTAAA